MRILVCGGRDFGIDLPKNHPLYEKKQVEKKFFFSTIYELLKGIDDVIIISGCATGADTLAIDFADRIGLDVIKFPANWKLYGRAAGPRRNIQMLEEGKPDWVIAFPGGNGTKHMCTISEKAGIMVKRIEYNESVSPLDIETS